MSRITYHCPDCGDPDAPDATHCITADGTFYWNVKTQSWDPSDGPNTGDLYCSECGDIGWDYRNQVEVPDLTPLQKLHALIDIADDLELRAARARAKVNALKEEMRARFTALKADRAQELEQWEHDHA